MTGMDLDVLRPATFTRLSSVLRAAADAGRPYHVVHFDGHGTWLDVADLEPDQADDGPPPGAGVAAAASLSQGIGRGPVAAGAAWLPAVRGSRARG